MTVEEASEEFYALIEEVYKQDDITPKERTEYLKQRIENVMKKKQLPTDMQLWDETQTGGCAWYVIL